jgi:hypothetical protein
MTPPHPEYPSAHAVFSGPRKLSCAGSSAATRSDVSVTLRVRSGSRAPIANSPT